jgi:hypothetical protein
MKNSRDVASAFHQFLGSKNSSAGEKAVFSDKKGKICPFWVKSLLLEVKADKNAWTVMASSCCGGAGHFQRPRRLENPPGHH